MSTERDIAEIKRIFEAEEVFKPATEIEVARRRAELQNARNEAERKHFEQLGRSVDTCPHCGASLRDENIGVTALETAYNSVFMYYDTRRQEWEYGDTDTDDAETTGYECGKCRRPIERFRDFDFQPKGSY